MVEKIYITPGNVRGLGNIVSTKTASDFTGNYANIVQSSTGDFILSYEGLLLKFNTSLASTIKDMTAYLYCTVLLEEDNSPIEDLTVTCTFEDGTVLTETTDTEGEVTFTWTPLNLGEETVTINCSNQGDYASHTQTVDIRIGLLLNFYGIMTGLTCEDDEYYEGTFETNIEHRSQLSTYIKDIFVADGGERCVAQDGLVYIADPGDLVVTYDNLDQDDDYSNVIFEGEVDSLVGAVYGMSINSNDEIILTRLEREDIVGDVSGVSVGLSVSSGSISVGQSVVLTAEVLSAGEPASGETVSFYDGNTLLGTDETDSDGIATYTASSLGVGSHSLTASALDKSSSAVTVTVNKLTSTITLSVPASGTVGTSYSITGTLVPTSGSVKLYENSVLKDTLTVSSGSFSKSITQSNEGTYSYYAVFEGSSTYSSVTSSTGSIVVSDVPPVPVVTSVSLSADKSILSYADSESATLSATVLDDNDDPMEGVTVTFYNGSTSMGTADTNSSGIATKTYASTGAGDLSFTASVGTISSETYTIEDCVRYDSASTDKVSDYTVPSGLSMSWSTDHYVVSSTVTTANFINFCEVGSEDFEMSALINTTNRNMGIAIFNDDSHTIGLYGVSSGTGFLYANGGNSSTNRTSGTLTNNTWYKYTISKTGSTYTGTIETLDGTVFGTWTQTVANFTKTRLISVWNVSMQIKDIKVKPL